MMTNARKKILLPLQVIFLLSICSFIGNTATLSLDSLHSSRVSEEEKFKSALDKIHYRRSMLEKRRQPNHHESKFSNKDFYKMGDQEDGNEGRNYYQPYASSIYSLPLSRNVQRFISEIDNERGDQVKKKKDSNTYGIRYEEELKPDGSYSVEEVPKKRRFHKTMHDMYMEGPSRIFTHKTSPISENMQDDLESPSGKDLEEGNHHGMFIKRRKKGRSNLFNYSRGSEHYSRFWDPERKAGRFQKNRIGDMSNSEEPAVFQKSKRRFSKPMPNWNEPMMKSHKNIKRSKDSKEQVLGELNEILKDEDDEKRDIKKRDNENNENKITETKLDNSSEAQGNEPSTEKSFDEPSEKKEGDEDKFDEWLRDEYFKTMAMTMATMKKKRGAWTPIVSGDLDEGTLPRQQQMRTIEDLAVEKSRKFQEIEERLESIESAMLSDALELIRENAEDSRGSEAYGEQVLNKLYAANDVQKMREALNHLKRTMDNMRQDQNEYEEDDEEGENSDDISNWPNISSAKREENLAKALRVMAPPPQSKRQYLVQSGTEPYIPSISMRSLPPFTPDEDNSDQLVSLYDMSPKNTPDVDVSDSTECPALDLLSSDCSVMGDIVPGGPLKRLVLEACNWHEVCYTCGGSFGLSADECDVAFVEQSRTICEDDVPCKTTAKMMLLPLRQRRVFFKRSVPAICYRDPCVERFLQHG